MPPWVKTGEDKIYETSLGGNVEFPLAITRRGDFKDAGSWSPLDCPSN